MFGFVIIVELFFLSAFFLSFLEVGVWGYCYFCFFCLINATKTESRIYFCRFITESDECMME